jgi:glycosyltransferase involved in cell wall biosynthesis
MAKMTKILYIEEVSGMGGSTVCLSNLIAGLTDKNVNRILTIYFKNNKIEQQMFPGIKCYHLNKYFGRLTTSYLDGWKSLSMAKRIFKIAIWGTLFTLEGIRRTAATYWIIKNNKVDLVHTNNALGTNMFSILAAKLANVPCVCHVRCFATIGRFQKICLSYASRIITISDIVKEELEKEKLVRDNGRLDKIITIYDGLVQNELDFDYKKCRLLRQEYNISECTKAVGMVGMLTEWKGFHVFLEAAKEVLEVYHDVVFFVVGDSINESDTSYKKFLLSKVEELGITKKVIFTGLRLDVKDVNASLDIFVHASLPPEPFGRVVIEAMAAAKPVVATDAGGPAEIIQHGQTGLLYKSGDSQELSQHILLLLRDTDMCERIGINAKNHVAENFNIESTVRETMDIYNEIINQRSEDGKQFS